MGEPGECSPGLLVCSINLDKIHIMSSLRSRVAAAAIIASVSFAAVACSDDEPTHEAVQFEVLEIIEASEEETSTEESESEIETEESSTRTSSSSTSVTAPKRSSEPSPAAEAPASNAQSSKQSNPPASVNHDGFRSPVCDGSYILIVESVVVSPSDPAKQQKINEAQARHPGSLVTYPGHCSSLRGHLDGNEIYPIYYSFGNDVSSLCSAKASRGGNARSLNHQGDFSAPC